MVLSGMKQNDFKAIITIAKYLHLYIQLQQQNFNLKFSDRDSIKCDHNADKINKLQFKSYLNLIPLLKSEGYFNYNKKFSKLYINGKS